MQRERMTDRAVYLGDGVWWQVSERMRRDNPEIERQLPVKIRPWKDCA